MTSADHDWEWVIPPEDGDTTSYSGADLKDNISIGEHVYTLRTSAGLSPQDVEDYAGIKKADLLALEAGLLQMNANLAESLSMVLGVSASELYTR